jgi:hypothetical protein
VHFTGLVVQTLQLETINLDYEHFIVIITAQEEPAIHRLITDEITG